MPHGQWELERILASDQPKGPLNSGLRLSRPGAEAWSQKGRRGEILEGKKSMTEGQETHCWGVRRTW